MCCDSFLQGKKQLLALEVLSIQIVHFDKPNSRGVVHPADNRGVVTRWQCCDNRRLPWICWSMAAVPDILNLIAGDDPANYRIIQLSLEAIKAPVLSCSSNVGSANALGTPNW